MRDPDKSGVGGRAWLLPDATTEQLKANPNCAAAIVTWLINCPTAHPVWHYWLLWCVSLRDLPGQTHPPARHYIGAEFEIGIYSIDPEKCPEPDPSMESFPALQPVDLVYQSHGLRDDQIKTIVALMIDHMMGGHLSPDSDYRNAWKSVLSQTITHYRDGKHG